MAVRLRRPTTTKQRFSLPVLPCRESVLVVKYGIGVATKDDTRTITPSGGGTMLPTERAGSRQAEKPLEEAK